MLDLGVRQRIGLGHLGRYSLCPFGLDAICLSRRHIIRSTLRIGLAIIRRNRCGQCVPMSVVPVIVLLRPLAGRTTRHALCRRRILFCRMLGHAAVMIDRRACHRCLHPGIIRIRPVSAGRAASADPGSGRLKRRIAPLVPCTVTVMASISLPGMHGRMPITGRLPAQAVRDAARCQRLGLGPACGLDTGTILGTAPGANGRRVLERRLDVVLVIQRQGRVPVGRITGLPTLAERARILTVKAGRTGGQIGRNLPCRPPHHGLAATASPARGRVVIRTGPAGQRLGIIIEIPLAQAECGSLLAPTTALPQVVGNDDDQHHDDQRDDAPCKRAQKYSPDCK